MTRDRDGIVMVYVPTGSYTMGATPDQIEHAMLLCSTYRGSCNRDLFADEESAHTVTLDAFWLDSTEVTNAQ